MFLLFVPCQVTVSETQGSWRGYSWTCRSGSDPPEGGECRTTFGRLIAAFAAIDLAVRVTLGRVGKGGWVVAGKEDLRPVCGRLRVDVFLGGIGKHQQGNRLHVGRNGRATIGNSRK